MATRVTEGARRERHEKRESQTLLGLPRACTALSKSKEKERLVAVYFLSSVAADGKDGHGLKLEKVGLTFSSLNTLPTKITKKVLWLLLPNEICFISSS